MLKESKLKNADNTPEAKEIESVPEVFKKRKVGTIPSNISRINNASATLESLLAEINVKKELLMKTVVPSGKREIEREIEQLQARLDCAKSDMRKAHDTFRKNLKGKKQI